MKIERRNYETATLEEFADRHGLTLIVEEVYNRDDAGGGILKYAWLDGLGYLSIEAEVREGRPARLQGKGRTEAHAIRDYIANIHGRDMVIDRPGRERERVDVPILSWRDGEAEDEP